MRERLVRRRVVSERASRQAFFGASALLLAAGAGSEAPPDDWYLNMIARMESLCRAMVVANYIDPVR